MIGRYKVGCGRLENMKRSLSVLFFFLLFISCKRPLFPAEQFQSADWTFNWARESARCSSNLVASPGGRVVKTFQRRCFSPGENDACCNALLKKLKYSKKKLNFLLFFWLCCVLVRSGDKIINSELKPETSKSVAHLYISFRTMDGLRACLKALFPLKLASRERFSLAEKRRSVMYFLFVLFQSSAI